MILPKPKSNHGTPLNKIRKLFPHGQVQPSVPWPCLPLQPHAPPPPLCPCTSSPSGSHSMLLPECCSCFRQPSHHGHSSTDAVAATCCPQYLFQKMNHFPLWIYYILVFKDVSAELVTNTYQSGARGPGVGLNLRTQEYGETRICPPKAHLADWDYGKHGRTSQASAY